MVSAPTYPAVEVELIGTDGNAFALIGEVAKALRKEVSREASDQFKIEAMSQGSYDELCSSKKLGGSPSLAKYENQTMAPPATTMGVTFHFHQSRNTEHQRHAGSAELQHPCVKVLRRLMAGIKKVVVVSVSQCLVLSFSSYDWRFLGVGGNGSPLVTVASFPVLLPLASTRS